MSNHFIPKPETFKSPASIYDRYNNTFPRSLLLS